MTKVKIPEWLKDQEHFVIGFTGNVNFLDDEEYKFYELFYKLLADDPELEKMWKTLKKWGDDQYFLDFFHDVRESLTTTKFSYYTQTDIDSYADEISKLSKKLADLLTRKEFDTQIYYALNDDTRNYLTKVHRIYEYTLDELQSDTKAFLRKPARDIQVSDFLMQLSEMAQKKAKEKRAVVVSNTKKKQQAYFIRSLVLCMNKRFSKDLEEVVATASSIIFDNEKINRTYITNKKNKKKDKKSLP